MIQWNLESENPLVMYNKIKLDGEHNIQSRCHLTSFDYILKINLLREGRAAQRHINYRTQYRMFQQPVQRKNNQILPDL